MPINDITKINQALAERLNRRTARPFTRPNSQYPIQRMVDPRTGRVIAQGVGPGAPNLPPQEQPQSVYIPDARKLKENERAVAQWFWLNMSVPFTGAQGEQAPGNTQPQNFPLLIRGAWTTFVGARVTFKKGSTGDTLSDESTKLRTFAGNSELVHPMRYWTKPYFLQPNTFFQGFFINDQGEDAGRVVFHTERIDKEEVVSVEDSDEFRLSISLGYDGNNTPQPTQKTSPVGFPVLIWGISATVQNATVRFIDTQTNSAWSEDFLPMAAFAGFDSEGAGGEVEPVMMFPTPYYLAPNTAIKVETATNPDLAEGGFVTFICERILRGGLV